MAVAREVGREEAEEVEGERWEQSAARRLVASQMQWFRPWPRSEGGSEQSLGVGVGMKGGWWLGEGALGEKGVKGKVKRGGKVGERWEYNIQGGMGCAASPTNVILPS